MPFVLGRVGIVATYAMLVGVAFIFGKTVPSMPNKVCRFVFLFALWVPYHWWY